MGTTTQKSTQKSKNGKAAKLDLKEWAATVKTKTPPKQCRACLNPDAAKAIDEMLELKRQGETTHVSQPAFLRFLKEHRGYVGSLTSLKRHLSDCLKRHWTTGLPIKGDAS